MHQGDTMSMKVVGDVCTPTAYELRLSNHVDELAPLALM